MERRNVSWVEVCELSEEEDALEQRVDDKQGFFVLEDQRFSMMCNPYWNWLVRVLHSCFGFRNAQKK